MNQINGKTRLTGVFGWPAEHTLSPAMQNPAMDKLGLNWIYVPLPVHPDDLPAAVAGARAMGFVGVNVTIPHKQAVIPLLDQVDPAALAIGAVNCIHFTEQGSIGYNTDAEGYTRTVEAAGFDFKNSVALQIGAGGAGRAMAAGAAKSGARKVFLRDIDLQRAQGLANDLAALFNATQFVTITNDEDLAAAAGEAGLIANATPLGMKSDDPLPFPANMLDARHTVFDAVYVPAITKLLAAAQSAGARAVQGAGMLARQGSRALEIWSGQTPDESLMLYLLQQRLSLK